MSLSPSQSAALAARAAPNALHHPWVPSSPRPRPTLLPKPTLPGQRLLGPAVALLLWTLVSLTGLADPDTLPAPSVVARTLSELLQDGYLLDNLAVSVHRAVQGLLWGIAAGVVLALITGLTRPGDALIDGLVQIKRAIPNLALIPLFILWMGIGEGMKVTVIALGVFVPIYINTHAALRDIDLRYVELAQSLEMTRSQFLRFIVFPACLSGFFTGLRLAATHAWTALVVVETINATSGIGHMISQARIYGQIEVVMVGLVIYGVLGFGTDALIRALQTRVLAWRQTLSQ